jgi:hypothetical protein
VKTNILLTAISICSMVQAFVANGCVAIQGTDKIAFKYSMP